MLEASGFGGQMTVAPCRRAAARVNISPFLEILLECRLWSSWWTASRHSDISALHKYGGGAASPLFVIFHLFTPPNGANFHQHPHLCCTQWNAHFCRLARL